MESRNIVVILNTEFVLLSFYIYYKSFLEKFDYNYFIIFNKSSDERFKNINLEDIKGEKIFFYNNILSKKVFIRLNLKKIKKIKNVNKIILQNPGDTLNHVLYNTIKKNSPSAKTIIISDAIGIDFEPTTKTKLKIFLKRLYRKMLNPWINIPLKIRGYKDFIESGSVLIAHRNIGFENFVDIKKLLLNTLKYKREVFNLFNLHRESVSEKYDAIFFTQPILNDNFPIHVKAGYYEFLKKFTEVCNSKKIRLLIKVHPGEKNSFYEQFSNNFVTVFEYKNVPSEVLLPMFENIKILSMWSSTSIFDILGKNDHYWLYPIINYHIPKQYTNIKVIKDFDELLNIFK